MFSKLFLLSIISVFVLVQPAFGQRALEVEYPAFGGITPVALEDALPNFVLYVFNFFVAISGLLALGSLIYGGVRYVISAGNPAALKDAQSQMIAGFLGAIIILGAYLVAQNINPQLVIPQAELEPAANLAGEIPGVYLIYQTPEGERKELYLSNSTALLPPGVNEMVRGIRFVKGETSFSLGKVGEADPSECNRRGGSVSVKEDQQICTIITDEYGAVLHEHQDFTGECSVMLVSRTLTPPADLIGDRTTSVITFIQGDSTTGGVWLCKDENHQKCYGPYHREQFASVGDLNGDGTSENDQINSIKIEGGYLAVLFDEENYGGKCQVFMKKIGNAKDPSFRDDPIGRCGCILGAWGCHSCVSSFRLFPIKE